VTSPASVYHQILPYIRKAHGGEDGAAVLGVHVEGPFISKEKKGFGFQPNMLRKDKVRLVLGFTCKLPIFTGLERTVRDSPDFCANYNNGKDVSNNGFKDAAGLKVIRLT
jgi:hypothetical protein